MNRFDSIQYDEHSVRTRDQLKLVFQDLEALILRLGPGRAQSLVLTHIEEAYMWAGRAIAEEQAALRKTK